MPYPSLNLPDGRQGCGVEIGVGMPHPSGCGGATFIRPSTPDSSPYGLGMTETKLEVKQT
jgi:hypothetical protein